MVPLARLPCADIGGGSLVLPHACAACRRAEGPVGHLRDVEVVAARDEGVQQHVKLPVVAVPVRPHPHLDGACIGAEVAVIGDDDPLRPIRQMQRISEAPRHELQRRVQCGGGARSHGPACGCVLIEVRAQQQVGGLRVAGAQGREDDGGADAERDPRPGHGWTSAARREGEPSMPRHHHHVNTGRFRRRLSE